MESVTEYLIILVALIITFNFTGLIFIIRWNVLLRRLEKTRSVWWGRNLNPMNLYSYMKNYTPKNDDEAKIFKRARNSFRLSLVFFYSYRSCLRSNYEYFKNNTLR